MFSRRTKKIFVVGLGIVLLTPLLLLVVLPLWFPWAFKAVTEGTPLTFSEYERLDSGHFRLKDVGFTNGTVHLSARSVESALPHTWVWSLRSTPSASNAPLVSIEDWRLEVQPPAPNGTTAVPDASQPAGPSEEAVRKSVYTEVSKVLQAADTIGRWLPFASASNGTAVVSGTTVLLPATQWAAGEVQTTFALPSLGETGRLEVLREPGGDRGVHIVFDTMGVDARLRVSLSGSNLVLLSTNSWKGTRVLARAEFGPEDVLPSRASIRSANLEVPADTLNLDGYQPLTGALSADWNAGEFQVSSQLRARPQAGNTNLPPAEVTLNASGDTNSVLVQQVQVQTPWLQARLAQPVRVVYRPPFVTTPAEFTIRSDLARQPFLALAGTITGRITGSPGTEQYPALAFSLAGEELGYEDLPSATLRLDGTLVYPTLNLSNVMIVLDDGSSVVIQGDADLRQKMVRQASVKVRGGFPGNYLPPRYSYRAAGLEASFVGPFDQLAHQGEFLLEDAQVPGVPVLQVSGAWAGTNVSIGDVRLGLQSSNAAVRLTSSVDGVPKNPTLQLRSLSISTNGQELLALQDRSEIRFATLSSNEWACSATPIRLAGPAGSLVVEGSCEWPAQGEFRIAATNVDLSVLSGLAGPPVPVRVDRLAAGGQWSKGPASLSVELRGGGKTADAGTNQALNLAELSAALEIHTTADGLSISNLAVVDSGGPLVTASGFLPLTVHPGSGGDLVRLESSRPIQFSAQASSTSALWQEIGRKAGVDFKGPELSFHAEGTPESPRGGFSVKLDQLVVRSTNAPPVELRNLVLRTEFDRKEARIELARVLVQGQPVEATGTLPLGWQFWSRFPTNPVPDLGEAELRLRLQQAPISAFALLYPKLLAPEGQVQADLALRQGGAYGEVVVSGAGLRPIPGVGPIQAINLRLALDGTTATFEKGTARFGTATLNLAGRADLGNWDQQQEVLPPLQLTLKGSRVPLSRSPDLILRSDLDLRLDKTNGAPMLVTGNARLQKSFFLTDLRALMSGGTTGPRKAAPYFSINTPFLAPWRLGINVTGEKFMKVRSPVFNGEVSANLRMTGTLGEPVALGDVQVDSGVVRFPFTRFQVQQGTAVITSQEPGRPHLNVIAGAEQYGYDLKLEVTGPADAPILQFSSTPPLSSERILLMITAGQFPGANQDMTTQRQAQAFATFFGRDLINKLSGGEPAEERLTIKSGSHLSEEGRATYLLEYRFADNWYLVGEYDRFSEFNVGIKWRFYTK